MYFIVCGTLQIIPHVDSLGLNEQELAFISHVADGPYTNEYPVQAGTVHVHKVSQSINNLRVFVVLFFLSLFLSCSLSLFLLYIFFLFFLWLPDRDVMVKFSCLPAAFSFHFKNNFLLERFSSNKIIVYCQR